MILLFEGVDKAGKSTLIKNFQDLSGMKSYKSPIKPTADLYDIGFINGQYYGTYNLARVSNQDFIFDRSHITELCYAEVKRGYKPQTKFWAEWEELNKHWVTVVFIDAPLETLERRFEEDKEEYLKKNEIKFIAEKYEEYFKTSKLNLIYIDGSRDRQGMLSQLVIQLNNLGLWTSVRNR
jgi:thymidylate kinase